MAHRMPAAVELCRAHPSLAATIGQMPGNGWFKKGKG